MSPSRRPRRRPQMALFLGLAASNVANAALPNVDFGRMGSVGLAGSFAGLQLGAPTAIFDAATASLLSRDTLSGSLSPLGATNAGGSILAGCALKDSFYFGGSFSSINGTTAANAAVFTGGSFKDLSSPGPIMALYCDSSNNKVWAGGNFTGLVSVYDPSTNTWSAPSFGGLSGSSVRAIALNASANGLIFGGAFSTSFQGAPISNGTNNPNVPFSAGATPFSSSLVPVPLDSASIVAQPVTQQAGFTNVTNILCPAGADGPGQTWLARDGSTATITARAFSFITALGVRLGNTFVDGRGTTTFSVTTIPNNAVQSLIFFNPSTGQNQTCSDSCPLLSDTNIPYQDFLFTQPLDITGIQVTLSGFKGAGAGLHFLQLLSSGAFVSSIEAQNAQPCFAPAASNVTFIGSWTQKTADTSIPATVQAVLTDDFPVGTPSTSAPSITWRPYISASGDYDIDLLVPGCVEFQDCPKRTTVKVTVFPGGGLSPSVTTVSQQVDKDTAQRVYSGPVFPTTPDFVATVQMALADNPTGKGQNGQYELVADRIQLTLKSVNTTGAGTAGGNGTITGNGRTAFGVFEWPLTGGLSSNATSVLPNTTITPLDTAAIQLNTALGSSGSSAVIDAVALHQSTGSIFIGGTFTLSSGSSNVVAIKDGGVAQMALGGLNGRVNAFAINGNTLFVGGSFTGTSLNGGPTLGRVAAYSILQNSWSSLGNSGVDGDVASLSVVSGKLQVVGDFTQAGGSSAGGVAVYDISSGSWVNPGGFTSGRMTLVTNGTSPSSQFLAGNVAAAFTTGSDGFVTVSNAKDGSVSLTALGTRLGSSVNAAAAPSSSKRWTSGLFARQGSQSSTTLPALAPATAPAVLAGIFWTNASNSHETAIIGGNFSVPTGGQGIAVYDTKTNTLLSLPGAEQVSGVVRTLLVEGKQLFVGGAFSVSNASANNFAIYDLDSKHWDSTSVPVLQPDSGSSVVVRSVTSSPAKSGTVFVAGSFASAGSLPCQGICSWDTNAKQWFGLGSGIQGEVASVAFGGDNSDVLIASGSFTLNNAVANVAAYSLSNSTWSAVGSGVPGPVTAVEVNNGNISSIFAGGVSGTGNTPFLSHWNGAQWTAFDSGSGLQQSSSFAQLSMVPLQSDHPANGVIESDRALLVSGSLLSSSNGNSSSLLFDGQTFTPYITAVQADGSSGSASQFFHSAASFSFNRRKFLVTGIVILISIAIAAGIVFLIALIGILWALFSRRDDSTKLMAEYDDDDESDHHRPSSLLEHIHAATRDTILGAGGAVSPFDNHRHKDGVITPEADPFAASTAHGHENDGFARAETPSEAMAGMRAGQEERFRPAHARYSFDGAGEGELRLVAGQRLEILDDRDGAWWYARDTVSGKEGVIPAAYVL